MKPVKKVFFYTWHHEDLCNPYTVIDQKERPKYLNIFLSKNMNAVMIQSHARTLSSILSN
jgi:cbb3-type cytochrome oxidase cytochrome c subunit